MKSISALTITCCFWVCVFSWFGNWDFSQFIRSGENAGRLEFVMFDAEGPGAIVRFWVTTAEYDRQGILRIYLDHSDTPELEGEILSLISGGDIIDAPLSESVSKNTEYGKRGHNLYLPIPYAGHCKITYENPRMGKDETHVRERIFYNINYRTYIPGTKVSTFSRSDLATHTGEIAKVQEALLSHPDLSTYENETGDHVLLNGEGAIRGITVKLQAGDYEQALLSTVLKISFDGKQTVWVPVGNFYGIGSRLTPYKTYYTNVSADSTLTCYWVMPYKKSCEVTLEHIGEQSVNKSLTVYHSDFDWSRSTMYFGAGWADNNRIFTRRKTTKDGVENPFDVNFVTLTGKGIYVGDALNVFNTAYEWWGEGDEKVYVDGEEFPSHIGTGTEDYYGYAWGLPAEFDHPFIAQPDGTGDLQPGHVSNLRYRSLDIIPFGKSLVFDIELWHWAKTFVNFTPTTYWYMLPGGESNRGESNDLF